MKIKCIRKSFFSFFLIGLMLLLTSALFGQAADDVAIEAAEDAAAAEDIPGDPEVAVEAEGLAETALEGQDEVEEKIFGAAVGIGIVHIDGQSWFQITGRPELTLFDDMLGIGLDLTFEVDGKGNIREENWNNAKALATKLWYARWGHKGDAPLYTRIGSIDSYDIGHGTLMNRFNNTIFYPNIKKMGLIFDLDLDYVGLESIFNDITIPDMVYTIAGARLYIRPIRWFAEVPVFDGLHIGGSFIIDRRPFDVDYLEKIVNDDGDEETKIEHRSVYEELILATPGVDIGDIEKKNLIAWGVDLGLPILDNFAIRLTLYADFNMILNYDWGVHWGFEGSINPDFLDLGYGFEVRHFYGGYMPRYFDYQYEANHAQKLVNLHLQSMEDKSIRTGWMFNLYRIFMEGLIGIQLSMEGVWPQNEELGTLPDMYARIWVGDADNNLFGFIVDFTYSKKNIHDFMDAFIIEDVDTSMMASLGYMITENVEIRLTYRKTFSYETYGENDDGNPPEAFVLDDNGEPKILPQESVDIETKIHF